VTRSSGICKILSKFDHPQQKKMTSCRFSRWQISAILDFWGPIMGSLKSRCMTFYRSSIDTIALFLVFEKMVFLHFGVKIQDGGSPPSTILDFRCPIMGSLKSPYETSYRSSIDTTALNCLVFEKIVLLYFGDMQTNKQTDRQTDRQHRCTKPLSLL